MKYFKKISQQKITPLDILNFFRQLSTLTTAGINLMQSLTILLQAAEKMTLKNIIHHLKIEIENGKELNQSLQKYPHYFNQFTQQLIYLGEHSGTLEIMLKKIVLQQEKNQALKQQIQQILIYPMILILSTLGIILFLLTFVIPQFALLFEHLSDSPIPFITRSIFSLAHFFQTFLPYLGICLIVLGIAIYLKKIKNISQISQYLSNNLPWIRNFLLKLSVIQFTQNLAIILSAGLPLTEALIIILPLFKNDQMKIAIHKICYELHAGKRFYLTLESNLIFPTLLVQLIRTGEESGTLPLMLEKFSEIYEDKIKQLTANLCLIIEPLIIVLLGIIIGSILIAMYWPIFRLGKMI